MRELSGPPAHRRLGCHAATRRPHRVARRMTVSVATVVVSTWSVLGPTGRASVPSAIQVSARPNEVPAGAIQESPPRLAHPEQQFLEALRSRGLDQLLEEYCRQKLQDSANQEASLHALALSETLIRRGVEAQDPSRRSAFWKEAEQLLMEFLGRKEVQEDRPALRWQLGLLHLLRAQEARLRWELKPEDPGLREEALNYARKASEQLRQVESDIQAVLRGMTPAASASRSHSYRALSDAASVRLGEAYLEEALLFDPSSPKRLQLARQATELLDPLRRSLLRSEGTDSRLLSDALLLLARGYIALGDYRNASLALNQLDALRPPTLYQDRTLLERARIFVSQHRWLDAYHFLHDAQRLVRTPLPELHLLYLEVCLRRAQEAHRDGRAQEAHEVLKQATLTAQKVDQQMGPYWAARADELLCRLGVEAAVLADLELLQRASQALARRGRYEEALRLLRAAARQAALRQDTDTSVRISMAIAQLRQQSGRLDEAARDYASLAELYPTLREAPEALLRSAQCWAELYRLGGRAESLKAYEATLERLVDVYGSTEPGREGAWLLAKLRAHQRRWPEARQLFGLFLADSGRRREACLQNAACYQQELEEAWAQNRPADALADEAAHFLHTQIELAHRQQHSQLALELTQRLVTLLAHPKLGRYDEALAVLETSSELSRPGPVPLSASTSSWVVVLVRAGRIGEAQQLIERMTLTDPEASIALAEELVKILADPKQERYRTQLCSLQQSLAARIEEAFPSLPQPLELRLQICQAIAASYAGDLARAARLFETVRSKLGHNAEALITYARNLSALGQFREARELWRRAGQLLSPPDVRYFEAKYELARACLELGDADQCRKIIEILEVLHPSLGGPEWKAKFADLKAKTLQQP